MPRFKYTPLVSAASEIRLLSLDPSGDLDDIRCKLTTHSLDSRPVYCALSYEWGDPDLPVDIKVNGDVFHARHNLWLFLHRLKAARVSRGKSSDGPTSRLWIDALCIDQKNVVERSAQVQLMGRIYQDAFGVIVWLGWSDGLSQTATSTVMKNFTSDSVYDDQKCDDFFLTGTCQKTGAGEDPTVREVCLFTMELCNKRYWTRRWIVQEILMAQRVLLMYGEQELPWAAICMMFKQYEKIRSNKPNDIYYDANAQLIDAILGSTAVQISKHQARLTDTMHLATLLRDYRQMQCEFVIDNVYALNSLITNGALKIDYSISAAELFGRVFPTLMKQDKFAVRDWRSYAADCGFEVSGLDSPHISSEQRLTPLAVSSPFITTCTKCVVRLPNRSQVQQRVRNLQITMERKLTELTGSPAYEYNAVKDLDSTFSRLAGRLEPRGTPESQTCLFLRSSLKGFNPSRLKDPGNPYKDKLSVESEEGWGSAKILGQEEYGTKPYLKVFSCHDDPESSTGVSLAVTWAEVFIGDVLCKVFGDCYLILREGRRKMHIVGPAWMSLEKYDEDTLRNVVERTSSGKKSQPTWKKLQPKSQWEKTIDITDSYRPRSHAVGRFWNQRNKLPVKLRFDLLEFTHLLEVHETMDTPPYPRDYEFPLQKMGGSQEKVRTDHPDTLNSMAKVPSTYIDQGRWHEAEKLEVQVMETYKEILGADHPETLNSMNKLASTYRSKGQWDKVEELEIQVMKTRKEKFGTDHPDTLTSMERIAYTWKRQSRDLEALSLMKECVQLRGRILGVHPTDLYNSEVAVKEWEAEES